MDRLKPNTSEWHARQRRHRHNSFLGHVAMARSNMHTILASDTTTNEAKAHARSVLTGLELLAIALRERKELSVNKPKAFVITGINSGGYPPGTKCYEFWKNDYGLAREDTRFTGQECISVTLSPEGDYPSFTVPRVCLKEVPGGP